VPPRREQGLTVHCHMTLLFIKAYLQLLRFEAHLSRGDFYRIYDKVRGCPIAKQSSLPDATKRICAAMDMACIWYWKEALCLQRSAATTCLLKAYGVPAQMVIGAQQLPFRSHAWVEVDGCVVNDKSYVSEVYAVLDRC
jgi:hypothetical protein